MKNQKIGKVRHAHATKVTPPRSVGGRAKADLLQGSIKAGREMVGGLLTAVGVPSEGRPEFSSNLPMDPNAWHGEAWFALETLRATARPPGCGLSCGDATRPSGPGRRCFGSEMVLAARPSQSAAARFDRASGSSPASDGG